MLLKLKYNSSCVNLRLTSKFKKEQNAINFRYDVHLQVACHLKS